MTDCENAECHPSVKEREASPSAGTIMGEKIRSAHQKEKRDRKLDLSVYLYIRSPNGSYFAGNLPFGRIKRMVALQLRYFTDAVETDSPTLRFYEQSH